MPRTLQLLRDGRLTVPRALALINELERVTDDVVLLVDEQIAEQVTKLSALGTAGTRHLIIGNVDVPGDLVLQSGEGRICRRP